MNTEKFVYVMFINTSPQTLWNALTTSEFTEKYWGPEGRKILSDWKIGSSVSVVKPDGSPDWQGEVLACEPPKKLSFTFHLNGSKELSAEPVSKVTYLIEPAKASVKLTVIHEELSEKVRNGISQGWPQILSVLKTLLETGNILIVK